MDTISQQAARLSAEWATDARWKDTSRTYSAEDVIRLRGTVQEEYTLARLGAERLRKLLAAEDVVAGVLSSPTGGPRERSETCTMSGRSAGVSSSTAAVRSLAGIVMSVLRGWRLW